MDHGLQNEGYAWEEAYKRSWDILADDVSLETLAIHARRSQHTKNVSAVQRGIIRYVVLIVDLSIHALATDWRPTAAETALFMIKSFVSRFFDQNPLSLLSVCALKEGIVFPISSFSSNPSVHLQALELKENRQPKGEPSIQNALMYALNTLSLAPSHGTKQVILVYSALTSCDPGDIFETIKEVSRQKIQVDVIGLSAQIQICKNITTETGGKYHVAINESHIDDLVNELIQPPPIQESQPTSNLILMGFPQEKSFQSTVLCIW